MLQPQPHHFPRREVYTPIFENIKFIPFTPTCLAQRQLHLKFVLRRRGARLQQLGDEDPMRLFWCFSLRLRDLRNLLDLWDLREVCRVGARCNFGDWVGGWGQDGVGAEMKTFPAEGGFELGHHVCRAGRLVLRTDREAEQVGQRGRRTRRKGAIYGQKN